MKKFKSLLYLILMCLLISTKVFSSEKNKGFDGKTYEIGKVYHGFKFVREQTIPEYNANGKLFKHLKSGARLLKIETDDDNKTFSIGFRTPPLSDCGTAHILEHSVLNGSKNFPVKSPFAELRKTSLNTYINAFTGSDFTFYPTASRNKKDYQNLMHVYLDAVFFPMMKTEPKIFKQEGWHFELESIDAPLKINGIVYNEMKGDLSEPKRQLEYLVNRNLFPDTCYRFDSGGHPNEIPKLTFEKFKSFHDRYYHPSNSYILIYGDFPLDKELAFINREYLSKFNRKRINSEIKTQQPFKRMKEIVGEYPLPKGDNTQNKTYLNLSFVYGAGHNTRLKMVMNILSYALVNFNDGPVRRALQKAGIGKQYRCSSNMNKQLSFSLTVEKANPEDKERFKKVVFDTLRNVVKKGLDKKIIKGYLNQLEFGLREPQGGLNGIFMAFNTIPGWFYGNDPFKTISYKSVLDDLKLKLKTNYYEEMIKKILVNNSHSLIAVLKANSELSEIENKNLKKDLSEIKNAFSKEDLGRIVKETGDLKKYQRRKNSKDALAKMPELKLEDIKKRNNYFKLNSSQYNGIRYLSFPVFSKDIVYAKAIFDAKTIPQKLIPYVELLTYLLGQLDTKNYTYGELNKSIMLNTGGINIFKTTYYKDRNLNAILPKVILSGKMMNQNINPFVLLSKEIISHSKLDDRKRVKVLLNKHLANLEARMDANEMTIGIIRLRSYLSNGGKYDELTQGISYFNFISDLVKNFDKRSDEIINNLKKVKKLIFNKKNIEIAVTATQADINIFQKKMQKFVDSLGNQHVQKNRYQFNFNQKNEGITSASNIQYVIQGFNFKHLGYKYSGKMKVLEKILSRDYLFQKIRVIGGAYGGFSGFRRDGFVYLGSYRDPNLKKTLDVYKKTVAYLKNFKVDRKTMVGYIIGTLSRYEKPVTPQMKGDLALQNHYECVTAETFNSEREEILSTTSQDIQKMYKMVSDIIEKNIYCVIGNDKKINDSKEIFNRILKSKG